MVAVSNVPTSIDEIDVDDLTERIVEEIERPQQATRTDDQVGGYIAPGELPGMAPETMQPDCGDSIPHFCTHCGGIVEIGRTCKQSMCPRCAPMWVVDIAETKTARLQSVAKTMSARLDAPVFKHHLVISPPDDWFLVANDPLDKTFDVVKEILSLLNAEGAICAHGWTGKDGDDRGAWKNRLFNDRDWQTDVRPELKPNPHFHCVVASPFIAGGEVTKRVEEETGWVIDRIANEDTGRSLEDMYAVARALTYSISHSIIRTFEDGDNQAQIRTTGQHWHGGKDTRRVNVYDHVRRKAEIAVRKAAPTTLGVSSNNLRCESPIPESERRDDTIEPTESFDDCEAPSDSTASESGTNDNSSQDETEMKSCKAPLKPISEADEFLDDDDWLDDARYSDQLRREHQDWIALTRTDKPPPIVEAFTT